MKNIKYLTKTAVIERGWTNSAIVKFLGEPDKTSPNPYSRQKLSVKLFDLNRVEEVEQSQLFIEWQEKSKNRRQSAKAVVERKKEVIESEKSRIQDCWNKLTPLSSYQTANWTDFNWSHFRIEDSVSTQEQRSIAVSAVCKMLRLAYWIPVDSFFEVFNQWGLDAANTDDYASTIKSDIALNQWQGIPIVSFFLEDKMGKVQLDSGHHRWIALKRLRETNLIDGSFCVPVFDLNLMPICFDHKKHKHDARTALNYLKADEYSVALKIYSRENRMLALCSGIDC